MERWVVRVRVTAFCFSLSEVNLAFRHPSYVVPEGQIVVVTLESNVDIQAYFEVNISTVDGTAKGEGNCRSLQSSSGLYVPTLLLVLCAWLLSFLTSWGGLQGTQRCCGGL